MCRRPPAWGLVKTMIFLGLLKEYSHGVDTSNGYNYLQGFSINFRLRLVPPA
jgi:hypothetical protein